MITAFGETGCSASASTLLVRSIANEVHAPNVFSPNDDGINDQFTLYSTDDQRTTITVLAIFDRWGNKVFEARNIQPGELQQGWDGTFKGQTLDPGVFVYSALVKSPNGEEVPVTGDVTLVW
jgi:gliding motility-associated-like protein